MMNAQSPDGPDGAIVWEGKGRGHPAKVFQNSKKGLLIFENFIYILRMALKFF